LSEERTTVTDPKKLAWIAICGGIAAIFAGAIGEALSDSLAIAIVCAVFAGVLAAMTGFYVDRRG
jgi:ABC-type spermidine/putrescine transport system permease subunit II